ncbi:MAG TPA: UDP-N-acetylmuramoyl-tripeptide--D-alanyl-D-alanine ligase [Chitinophagaceae bacterium]|nr:UDP-N-acetylmuramoyl-tripeptide--D-alanyl-D-alanine ligase [Chitinophagaceae bacterium]
MTGPNDQMNIDQLYEIYLQHPFVQTDTRKLQQGDLFFALKGPNFNANLFANIAIAAGAAYAIVDEPPPVPHPNIIVVDDVLQTLQALAKHHRQQFDIPFIAITGSNGKTTTKELVHTVLATTYTTYTTQGNLNNHIGIPVTILKVKKDAQLAVIEMGANHRGEIASYCEYTLPTHGIITNCGKAHLEGFGGIEGVRKGKGELYDHLRTHEGTAFVMWDYEYLRNMSKGIPSIIKYGTTDADITGQAVKSEPFLEVGITGGTSIASIKTQLVGAYNLPNVLVAVAVGKYFKVPDEAIKGSIEAYTPSNSRSQLIERDGNKIILDAYNANPSSMKLAIENFAKLPAGDKVLMLGGMAELGEESLQEHALIVDLIKQHPWKDVVLVGGDFLKIEHPFRQFKNSGEAADWYRSRNLQGNYILIKGSRSMQMEKVLG